MATFKEVSPYNSQYGTQINNLTNAVVNRQAFTYDPNTDAAYKSYAKEYGRLGDRARQNTLGDYAANTGGYASSYAVSAAQQAQNDYNQQLSNLIPGLMDAAYSRYKDDFNMNTAALSALSDLDNTAYSRWNDNRTYNRSVYESDRDYQYQQSRDKVADSQWLKDYQLDVDKFKWTKSQGSSGRGGGSGRSGGSGRKGRSGGGSGGGGNTTVVNNNNSQKPATVSGFAAVGRTKADQALFDASQARAKALEEIAKKKKNK